MIWHGEGIETQELSILMLVVTFLQAPAYGARNV